MHSSSRPEQPRSQATSQSAPPSPSLFPRGLLGLGPPPQHPGPVRRGPERVAERAAAAAVSARPPLRPLRPDAHPRRGRPVAPSSRGRGGARRMKGDAGRWRARRWRKEKTHCLPHIRLLSLTHTLPLSPRSLLPPPSPSISHFLSFSLVVLLSSSISRSFSNVGQERGREGGGREGGREKEVEGG